MKEFQEPMRGHHERVSGAMRGQHERVSGAMRGQHERVSSTHERTT